MSARSCSSPSTSSRTNGSAFLRSVAYIMSALFSFSLSRLELIPICRDPWPHYRRKGQCMHTIMRHKFRGPRKFQFVPNHITRSRATQSSGISRREKRQAVALVNAVIHIYFRLSNVIAVKWERNKFLVKIMSFSTDHVHRHKK